MAVIYESGQFDEDPKEKTESSGFKSVLVDIGWGLIGLKGDCWGLGRGMRLSECHSSFIFSP